MTESDMNFYLTSPHGPKLKVPKAVYEAFEEFLAERLAGSVEVQFKNGGVAGVEGRKRYKVGGESVVTT